MKKMTESGKLVTGFGSDEWITSYASGSTGGSEYVAGSVLKRYDIAVAKFLNMAMDRSKQNLAQIKDQTLSLSVRDGAISMAPCHESCDRVDPQGSIQGEMTKIMVELMKYDFDIGIDSKSGDLKDTKKRTTCDRIVLQQNSKLDPNGELVSSNAKSNISVFSSFIGVILFTMAMVL